MPAAALLELCVLCMQVVLSELADVPPAKIPMIANLGGGRKALAAYGVPASKPARKKAKASGASEVRGAGAAGSRKKETCASQPGCI